VSFVSLTLVHNFVTFISLTVRYHCDILAVDSCGKRTMLSTWSSSKVLVTKPSVLGVTSEVREVHIQAWATCYNIYTLS